MLAKIQTQHVGDLSGGQPPPPETVIHCGVALPRRRLYQLLRLPLVSSCGGFHVEFETFLRRHAATKPTESVALHPAFLPFSTLSRASRRSSSSSLSLMRLSTSTPLKKTLSIWETTEPSLAWRRPSSRSEASFNNHALTSLISPLPRPLPPRLPPLLAARRRSSARFGECA